METQQIGKAIEIKGLSGKSYLFVIRQLNHNFSKLKPCSGLLFVTKQVDRDGLSSQRILIYDTIVDLPKFAFDQNTKSKLINIGATNLCVLTRTKPSGIEKIEKDIRPILGGLDKI